MTASFFHIRPRVVRRYLYLSSSSTMRNKVAKPIVASFDHSESLGDGTSESVAVHWL